MSLSSGAETREDLSLRHFRRALGALDHDSLFHAALLISAIHHGPSLKDRWWEAPSQQFDSFVTDSQIALHTLSDHSSPRAALEFLARHFHDDLGFHGNRDNYHAPENSSLLDALRTRQGLPLTVSILLITLGRRLHLDLFGVGTPGHFLVGANLPTETLYLDPFTGPMVMDGAEAANAVSIQTGIPADQIVPFLRAARPRDVLLRMLNNMKGAYMKQGDLRRISTTLGWILEVDSSRVDELRNRGLIRLRIGEVESGARDLLAFLAAEPGTEDRQLIMDEAMRARNQRARYN